MSSYENHLFTNPNLPFIFHINMSPTVSSGIGSANWHENIEIICVTGGDGTISEGGTPIKVQKGDTVIINSNRLHAFESGKNLLTYHCLIVDRSFCISNGFDTNKIEYTVHVRNPHICALMESLAKDYSSESLQSPYRVASIRSSVLQILVILCKNYSKAVDEKKEDTHLLLCIKKSIEYIHTHYSEDISMDFLAEHVGMSKYYFSHEFKKIAGTNFIVYLNRTRCNVAKKLLEEGNTSISSVAKSCGFESSSYFAKNFKKYTGVLPGKYLSDIKNPKK